MRCERGSRIPDCETADKLVERVSEKFQTRNVFELAEGAGLKIVYRRWYPATLGELDWRAKAICVNEAAGIDGEKIIAHELGHYFLREAGAVFAVAADEEKFCDEFAARLLKNG